MSNNVIPNTPSAAEYAADGSRDLSWIDAADPLALFEDWLAAAGETEPNDPHAMSVATVDGDGLPDVRILLLKGLDELLSRGGGEYFADNQLFSRLFHFYILTFQFYIFNLKINKSANHFDELVEFLVALLQCCNVYAVTKQQCNKATLPNSLPKD